MGARADTFDLGSLKLATGEGRRLTIAIALGDLEFGGEHYAIEPAEVSTTLDVSRMTHGGYALRLRFSAAIVGACMRCLDAAAPVIEVDAREVDQHGGGDELSSPYVDGDTLEAVAWGRDAFALELPAQVLCRPDCAGLCPQCGVNLNEAGPEHGHEAPPDPRWAKLSELKLE